MPVNLLERRDPTCATGQLFYTCDFEEGHVPVKFSGCCSVNACHALGKCPDESTDPLPSKSGTPKTTSTPSVTKSASTSKSTTLTATTSKWSPPPQEDATATTAPQISATPAQSHGPNVALIAGAVVGGFVLLMCASAIWFLLRNRINKGRITPPETAPLSPPPAWESKRGHENMTPMMKPQHLSMASSHWSEPEVRQNRLSELPSTHMDPVELPGEPSPTFDFRGHTRTPSDGQRFPLMQGQ